MKKLFLQIVFVSLTIILFSGCESFLARFSYFYKFEHVEKGHIASDDKLIVVIKVSFDVDPWTLINNPNDEDSHEMLIQYQNDRFKPTKFGALATTWEGYIVGEIPRDNIHVKSIYMGSGDGSRTFEYNDLLEFKINSSDKFVYLGEITHQTLNGVENVKAKYNAFVEDNYFEAKQELKNFVFDKNGEPIELQKRMLTHKGDLKFISYKYKDNTLF